MRSIGRRYSYLFIGQYLFLGMQLPFFPGWLDAAGFSGAAIGMMTGIALILRLIGGPLIAWWAEGQADQRRVLWAVTGVMAAAAGLMLYVPYQWAISILTIIMLFAFGCLVPLSDSALLRADRAGQVTYGKIRSVGSVAFIIANVAGGMVVARFGDIASLSWMIIAALVTFLVTLILPKTAIAERGVEMAGRLAPPDISEAKKLIGSPPFLYMMLAAGCIQGGHATYYYFSELHWSEQGFSAETIGWLWTVGVIAEIALLYFAKQVTEKIGPTRLIALGAIGTILRWPLTGLSPELHYLFPLQLLHALTFGCCYLGSVEYIRRYVPENLVNTSMVLVSTVGVGAITAIGAMIAGLVFDSHHPLMAYLVMSAMGGVALILTLLLAREQQAT
ncbi:MAG: MFS transporter [bacterium]